MDMPMAVHITMFCFDLCRIPLPIDGSLRFATKLLAHLWIAE